MTKTHLTKTHLTKTHLTKTHLTNISLLHLLFSEMWLLDGLQPIKIFFCFVKSEAVAGRYELNPFCFQRQWVVPKSKTFTKENFEDALDQNHWREELKKSEERQFKREQELQRKQKKFFKFQAKLLQKFLTKQASCPKDAKGKQIPGKNLSKNSNWQLDGSVSDEEWLPSNCDSSDSSSDSSNFDEFLSVEEEENRPLATNEGACGSKDALRESETSKIFRPFKTALKSAKKSLCSLSNASLKDPTPDPTPVPPQPDPKEETTVSYVVRFELEIDSHPIDQETML